jgi:hypothetical protein
MLKTKKHITLTKEEKRRAIKLALLDIAIIGSIIGVLCFLTINFA